MTTWWARRCGCGHGACPWSRWAARLGLWQTQAAPIAIAAQWHAPVADAGMTLLHLVREAVCSGYCPLAVLGASYRWYHRHLERVPNESTAAVDR